MADRLYLRLHEDPLHAPETTVPAGTMRAFDVPPALRDCVAHAMAYEERLPAGATVTEQVLPDGALRLVADTAGPVPRLSVIGPDTRAVVLSHQGEMQGLSLTLRPGAALALLGVPAHELAGLALDWETVAPPALRGLAEGLAAPAGPGRRMASLMRLLQAGMRPLEAPGRERTLAAMQRLAALPARQPVREAAAALGIGERRLEQLFRQHLGLSPKAWHRLARFHECVRLLRRRPAPGWAELAVQAGYADQAHLVHEFQAIAGMSPGEFDRARRISDSSNTRGQPRR